MDDATLLEALSFEGGKNYRGLQRSCCALLYRHCFNSAHPGVDYPRITDEVIADVNAALVSGDRNILLNLAKELDKDNNLVVRSINMTLPGLPGSRGSRQSRKSFPAPLMFATRLKDRACLTNEMARS
ncbi:MAG: hypothetical protein MZV64_60555 [Ignavibacteriales bacterium]|nr:hypothetical protein [Ignavibacteriales bacterium]